MMRVTPNKTLDSSGETSAPLTLPNDHKTSGVKMSDVNLILSTGLLISITFSFEHEKKIKMKARPKKRFVFFMIIFLFIFKRFNDFCFKFFS